MTQIDRALTPRDFRTLRAEQEALSFVRFYSAPPISKAELLNRIRADATVSEPVREPALQFARQWPETK